MSFSVSCARHGLEYTGRGRLPLGTRRRVRLVARDRRGSCVRLAAPSSARREQTVGGLVSEHGYSDAVPGPLPRPADSLPLVERHRRRTRVPRRATRCASSTTTACSGSGAGAGGPSSAAAGRTWRLCWSARERRFTSAGSAGRDARTRTRSSAHRRRRVAPRSTASCSPSHGDQALPLLADPGGTSGAFSPPSARPRTRRCCTPTSGCCREPAAARAVLELPPRRLRLDERPSDDHVLPQPPAAARHRPALLRDAEPDGRDRRRARDPPHLLRASPLHVRVAPGPGRAAVAERAAADGVRRRVAGHRLPRGRARLGASRRRRLRGGVVRSALYTGTVMHARTAPAENVFRYRVCFFVLDLDELPALDRQLRLFGWNRPNVVTLCDRDHIDVRAYLEAARDEAAGSLLSDESARARLRLQPGQLLLLLPRRRPRGDRRRGEQHLRRAAPLPALARQPGGGRSPLSYEHGKRLHVSPFFSLEQGYRWWFTEPGDEVHVRIDLSEDGDAALPRHAARRTGRSSRTRASRAPSSAIR